MRYLLLSLLMVLPSPAALATKVRIVIPLGVVTVTQYTHIEGGGNRVTSSGYVLTDADAGRVCAISRDLLGKVVRVGDVVHVVGYAEPCIAYDKMGDHNRSGEKQRQWIDIYNADYKDALRFGRQRTVAYIVRD
jgi:3D (Asp-Asp-Asp) domain-containing protein